MDRSQNDFDVIVIGAGSAGFAAARVAGGLGATVGLVDKGPLGGLCILRGCMPSKTILASADTLQRARQASGLGIRIVEAAADLPKIISRKRDLIRGFADFRTDQIHQATGTTLIEGRAKFVGAHEIAVNGQVYRAKSFVVATGSEISVPNLPGLEDSGYLTSDSALELQSAPESLVIMGGGVIGCELGQFYSRIGVRTTILHRGAHLLSKEDADVGECLALALTREGIEVVCGATALEVESRGNLKVVHADVGGIRRAFEAGEVLVSLGRHPAILDLGLEAAGVRCGASHIPVDEYLRTNAPHIYAAGDAIGTHNIVHYAIQQAEHAANNAVSGLPPRKMDSKLIPHVVFTDPQLGRVGITEREAAVQRLDVLVGKYAFADHGKAMCLGRTEGFAKMIADRRSGEILGAAVLGPEGGELVHEIVVAMHFNCTTREFLAIPHVHPTLAEILAYPAEEIEAQRQRILQEA